MVRGPVTILSANRFHRRKKNWQQLLPLMTCTLLMRQTCCSATTRPNDTVYFIFELAYSTSGMKDTGNGRIDRCVGKSDVREANWMCQHDQSVEQKRKREFWTPASKYFNFPKSRIDIGYEWSPHWWELSLFHRHHRHSIRQLPQKKRQIPIIHDTYLSHLIYLLLAHSKWS